MNIISIIGFSAAVCTCLSFLSQAIKTIRTKQTRDISLSMYITLNIGLFLWLVYGLLTHQPPVLYSNIVTLAFALIVLVVKIKNG